MSAEKRLNDVFKTEIGILSIMEFIFTCPAGGPEQGEGVRWPLWLLYFVWISDIVLLYFACRWYAKRKKTNPQGWMRFV